MDINGCEPPRCPPACELVFEMVHVSFLIRGGTRVLWRISPSFQDPFPWTFQLQAGATGSPNADDWSDVGLPVVNGIAAVDGSQRDFNKEINAHYRVVLTTPLGEYISQPTSGLGVLSARDWRLAREVVRKQRLHDRYAAQEGFLLKRRISGKNCSRCTELQTDEVLDPYCPECLGTGKQCGYFYPMSCVWAALSPAASKLELDSQGMRGVVQDAVAQATMLMLPVISEYDVWVAAKTDKRYLIRSINNTAEIRGVPLLASVSMRILPFSHVVYSIAIPEQDAMLAGG
jgi:hypothetical protein